MWRILNQLTEILKRIFIFLVVLSAFFSVDFLHIYSKRKVGNILLLSNNGSRIDGYVEVANGQGITYESFGTGTVSHTKRLLKIYKNTDKDIIDIMGKPPIKFMDEYKNPCFMRDTENHLFNDNGLHCLPYFYLLGVKKSGTTDLFHRIALHPDFRGPEFKEAHWFSKLRFGIMSHPFAHHPIFRKLIRMGLDNRSIQYYISLFGAATRSIQDCASTCITADGTPANLHIQPGWHLLPGNEGLTEPRYTTFHYIKHLTPAAKIIVIFRDPVTRLFSDFLHETPFWKRELSSEQKVALFHKQTSLLIEAYGACFKAFNMRRCIYNNTLSENLMKRGLYIADSFRAGFYAFYMKELLAVFSRNQILPLVMTDYLTNPEQTLKETFRFLEMSPLSEEELSVVLSLRVAKSAKKAASMTEETKTMLYNFYTPFNKEMAQLMENPQYMFLQTYVSS